MKPAVQQKLQTALAMHQAGQLEGAERLYREVLRADPKNVNALQLLGKMAMQIGRFGDAKPLIEKACALAPNAPPILDAMVDFHLKTNRPGKALEVMEKIVRLAPNSPDRWMQLGTLLTAEGAWERGVECYDKALALNPNLVRACAGKAMNLERRGLNDEVYEALAPFLGGENPDPHVLGIFATVAPKVGRTDEAIAMLAAAVQSPATPDEPRSILYFGLGDLYSKKKLFDEAFEAYANAQKFRNVPWSSEQAKMIHDLIAGAYSRESITTMVRSRQTTEVPVFIVGMPRSGTSLVEQTIASHPDAAGAGELPGIADAKLALHYATGGKEIFPKYLPSLTPALLDKAARDYLKTLTHEAPKAARVTDKAPSNFMFVGLIAQLFPNARIIHCKRHPLDSCVSCYTKRFTFGHGFTRSLEDLASYYALYERLMAHWHDVKPLPILDVAYEDMVADHEGMTRKILEFIGLPFDEACLKFYESDRLVRTASYDQVRKPIYGSSVARWRRYEKHLAPLITALRAEGVDVPIETEPSG